jgi:hypothetical protein
MRSHFVRRAAVPEVAWEWKDNPDAFVILKLAASDKSAVMRREALEELALHWKDNSEIVAILVSHVGSDEDDRMRKAAIDGLGGYIYQQVSKMALDYKDDSDTDQYEEAKGVSR